MYSRVTSNRSYKGLERRSSRERRRGRERRNLIRFESFGCDRRYGNYRRQEEMLSLHMSDH